MVAGVQVGQARQVPLHGHGPRSRSTRRARRPAILPRSSGYSTIKLPQERQQAIGVRLGKAETRDLTKTIRTVGRVTFDETLNRQIHAKFEGYVERLYVDYTGKPVRKGQPLLSIYSPELLATQQEYLLAVRARRAVSRRPRIPTVARGGVDLYESARQRLLLWDISPGQIAELEKTGKPQKALTLYSPVDGFVMTKNAVQGARVMPADTLFEIAGIHHVWVQADIYESEAPFVAVGQTGADEPLLSSRPHLDRQGHLHRAGPGRKDADGQGPPRVREPGRDLEARDVRGRLVSSGRSAAS